MLICGDAGIGRQASLRCLCQYWRVGSSPISRTSVKDIRFFGCPLFLYLGKSANYYHQKQPRWNRTKSLILWKRNLFRSQTGKPQAPQSVLACGFKSHFPHQCKGHSIFRVSFIFVLRKLTHCSMLKSCGSFIAATAFIFTLSATEVYRGPRRISGNALLHVHAGILSHCLRPDRRRL